MSYEIVKSIAINEKKGEVFITSAPNNVSPREFYRSEVESYEKMLKQDGLRVVLQDIGREVYSGNWHLKGGTKITNAFLEAVQWIPKGFTWETVATKTVGNFLGNCVFRIIKENVHDFSAMQQKLCDEVGTKEYALWMAEEHGLNSLPLCPQELQNDRALNLEVVKRGSWGILFTLPKNFLYDKEIVMEGLKTSGCLYRALPAGMRRDKEIIFEAFRNDDNKRNVEHVLSCIPYDVFFEVDTEGNIVRDDQNKAMWNPSGRDFFIELIKEAPQMHVWGCEDFYSDLYMISQMYKYCRYNSDVISMIPRSMGETALDTPLVQGVLYETCVDAQGNINPAKVQKLKQEIIKNGSKIDSTMYNRFQTDREREAIEEIIRNSNEWLTTMKELCELQWDKVCEEKEDAYPMEIVGFDDAYDTFITNPFIDSSAQFEIENPVAEYGFENVQTFLHEMNEVIGQYVKQLDTTSLRWDEEKNSKEIDIYCRAMTKEMENEMDR